MTWRASSSVRPYPVLDRLGVPVRPCSVALNSAIAAKRLLAAARQSHYRALAARGSRNVIFSSGYVYFLVGLPGVRVATFLNVFCSQV